MRQYVSFVVVMALAAAALPARAQSLADVARKEEERRKTISQPAKVYTNKDLTAAPPPPTPAPSGASASGDANASKADAAKTADAPAKDKEKDKGADAAAKEPARDKAYWAGRLKTLQEQLDRNRTYAEALQTRINALTADFVNRDDPAQRGVIERDRQKAIAELDRLKRTIQDDQKALADFSEEARRAGVPPGWLR